MLRLRPEWAKDDGHCQLRAIGGTVFGETSLEAAIEIRKNLVAWVTDNYNESVRCQLPDKSTKGQLLRRLQNYEYDANKTSVGTDYHGNADTPMVCALALGVDFLVLKVENEHCNRHEVLQPGNSSGKLFGLVYNYSGPHWSSTVAADGEGDIEAVYFLHQHPFASSHEGSPQCPEAGHEGYFLTVAQCFVYLKAMHSSEMANGNHLHFTGVAADILLTASTAEVGNMSARLGRHEDFDAGSWGAAREEKMLMALRAKFNSYPDLAKQLRDSAGRSLAQASQGDCDHGIGLGVVDAKLGMAWRGENFFGNCLELLRLELLAAMTQKVANRKRRREGESRSKTVAGKGGQEGQQGRQPKAKGRHAANAKPKPKPKPKPKVAAEKKVFITWHMSDGDSPPEEGEEPKEEASPKVAAQEEEESCSDDGSPSEEGEEPKKKAPPKAKPKPKPKPKPNQGQEGGTAPAGTKC